MPGWSGHPAVPLQLHLSSAPRPLLPRQGGEAWNVGGHSYLSVRSFVRSFVRSRRRFEWRFLMSPPVGVACSRSLLMVSRAAYSVAFFAVQAMGHDITWGCDCFLIMFVLVCVFAFWLLQSPGFWLVGFPSSTSQLVGFTLSWLRSIFSGFSASWLPWLFGFWASWLRLLGFAVSFLASRFSSLLSLALFGLLAFSLAWLRSIPASLHFSWFKPLRAYQVSE